jgi:RNA polymerase sigma-70 factor (ECF subfamily)
MDKKTFDKLLDIELGLLDEKHRSTFLMRYQHEMSMKEIAEALDISEGTVKSRLFYTIRKLSEKLKVFDLN